MSARIYQPSATEEPTAWLAKLECGHMLADKTHVQPGLGHRPLCLECGTPQFVLDWVSAAPLRVVRVVEVVADSDQNDQDPGATVIPHEADGT